MWTKSDGFILQKTNEKNWRDIFFGMSIEFFYSVELLNRIIHLYSKRRIISRINPRNLLNIEYYFPIMALQNYTLIYIQLRLIRLHCIKCRKWGIIRSLRIFNFYTSHWIYHWRRLNLLCNWPIGAWSRVPNQGALVTTRIRTVFALVRFFSSMNPNMFDHVIFFLHFPRTKWTPWITI
jgi:hypothetical protein